jgi:hypothetical protein
MQNTIKKQVKIIIKKLYVCKNIMKNELKFYNSLIINMQQV